MEIKTQNKSLEDEWYKKLNKSSLTPPGYVFGLVWTILYILLFIFFILSLRELPKSKLALAYFLVQLVLNLLWTYVFFSKRLVKTAFAMIAIIIVLSCLCLYEIAKVNFNLAFLLVPYIAWLLLASYFNIYIIINN